MSNLKQKNQKSDAYRNFDSFEEFFEQAEKRDGYWLERSKLEFTEEVLARMKETGITRTELAARLKSQPGMVTRLLSGRNNFELATMVRMARALDCALRTHLEPVGTKACWINVLNEEPEREPVQAWNPGEFHNVAKHKAPIIIYDAIPAAA
jgi:transcriptional regulator with XRE-family HTH domain